MLMLGANDIAIVEDIEDFRIGDYLVIHKRLFDSGLSHQHPALKSSVSQIARSKVISL